MTIQCFTVTDDQKMLGLPEGATIAFTPNIPIDTADDDDAL